ncbi:MAG TPA: YdbH domain-containing protein [Kofleriaceae bacterium]|nr:YdbH domain-containing protein [Kofleriaceae bacterium]
MLTAHASRRPSRARRWWIALAGLALVACGLVALHRALPGLIASRIERMLAERGFAGARVVVSSVALDRVELGELTLGDGLALGRVELDAGLSLLWQPRVHQLTIRDARLALGGPAGEPWVRALRVMHAGTGGEALPFDLVRLVGGVVILDGVEIELSGTLAPSAGGIAVDLQASAPRIQLGPLALRGLRGTLRDEGRGLRACATAGLAGALATSAARTDAAPARTRAVTGAIPAPTDAVTGAMPAPIGARTGAMPARTGAVTGAIPAPTGTVTGAVTDAVTDAVTGAMTGAAIDAVADAATGAVTDAATDAVFEACATLPALAQLGALRTVDVTWRAEAPAWQLLGRGTIGWARTLELTAGRVDGSAPSMIAGSATLVRPRLGADLAGRLSGAGALALEVTGLAQADRVELRAGDATVTARGLRLPLVAQVVLVDGELAVIPHQPIIMTARDAAVRTADTPIELVRPAVIAFDAGRSIPLDHRLAVPRALRWSAASARVGEAHVDAPSGALIARRTLRWRATEVEWRGARLRQPAGQVELDAARRHTTTWAALRGPGPIELGAGELRCHRAEGRWVLDRGRAVALGGELTIEPAAGQPAGELVLRARGLELHRVLAAFAHGHADGSDALDGELALQLGDAGVSVTRGALRARRPGTLQLSDPAWRARATASATGFALHQRIAATLSDFAYARLTAVLQPTGVDPELQVATQGRGKRVAQELDLVINLRGVRDVARRLSFAQPPRSKP